MSQTVTIHLKENVFGERETILAEYGVIKRPNGGTKG